MRKMMFIALASTLIIGATILAYAVDSNNHSIKENGGMTASELALRGKQLRKEIDETYKRMDDTHQIKSPFNGQNFITDVVIKYIPIGTSFDEAEAILRAAGFKVGPREGHVRSHDKFLVVADIDQYAPTPFGKTSVVVFLEPASQYDWSIVTSLRATIIRQFI